jgi:hypothetical protein
LITGQSNTQTSPENQSGMTRTSESHTPTRQPRWFFWARLGWICLFLLSAAKIVIGLPLHYKDMNRVCLAPQTVCSQGNTLTPQQAQALEKSGISLTAYARIDLASFVISTLIWAGIGLFIFVLRPDDWLAFIASSMMIVLISAGLEDPIRTAFPAFGVAADLIFNLGNILMFLFIALFPNGRFSPRWMRWYWLGMILFSLPPGKTLFLNPEIANIIIAVYWVSFLLLGPYSQIHRYRKESSVIERLQTKWVVFGFAVFAGSLLVGFALFGLLPEYNVVRILYNRFFFDAAGLLIPLSIGFSILRYHLWDVDILIRRALSYAILTALLGLVYFGGVTLLQIVFTALSGQQSPAALVISTLLIAALFTPLRRRIQEFIDQRFFRRKYDAEKALAEFAAAARQETDLPTLTDKLTDLVHHTLQPSSISLWLQSHAKSTYPENK